MKAFTIRPAKPDEAGIILDLIKQLALYERAGRAGAEGVCGIIV